MFWIVFCVTFPAIVVLAGIDAIANRISGFEDGKVRIRHLNPTSYETDEH